MQWCDSQMMSSYLGPQFHSQKVCALSEVLGNPHSKRKSSAQTVCDVLEPELKNLLFDTSNHRSALTQQL